MKKCISRKQDAVSRALKNVRGYFLMILLAGMCGVVVVPTTHAQVVRMASGATPADITAVRDQFRTDLGGGTSAGANGSFGGLRREINWDGVPTAFAAPNNLPANFFNVNSPRGVVLSTPGTGFQVSSTTSEGPINFGNINATYTTTFQQFSPQRLFTALGSNITDLNFFVPGTNTPSTVKGFGAVFTDVDNANFTQISFIDVNNNLLGTFFVPTSPNGGLSFLGVSFPTAVVARVRIVSGNAILGLNDNPPTTDVVVMDDFIYSEPTQQVTAGNLIISEFRLRGPNNALDEFVELYNNTDLPITIATNDGSSGFAVAASDGVVRFVVPNNTTIPARAHFLGVASGYSISTYPANGLNTATGDAAYSTDIPDNVGIALFNTATPANFNTISRLDSVGPTTEANTLYKEGTGYTPLTVANTESSFYRTMPSSTNGLPQDTNNNAADFIFVDTNGGFFGPTQRLGAPGPENRFSPIYRTTGVPAALIDPLVAGSSSPNRVRDTTPGPPLTSALGTLAIRRTFINTTGANITRLRFRIVDITTSPATGTTADLRAVTSSTTMVNTTMMGTVTAQGVTLETPPVQPIGGGFNSSLSLNTVTLAAPLPSGDVVSVNFVFGIQKAGNFRILINTERLP
jgi:hypothetical protein